MNLMHAGLLALPLVWATVAQAQDAIKDVKLYTLDCGRIDIADMDAFADDGSYKGVSKQLVVPCYLIQHPKGYLLWDAGVGDQFAGPKGVTYMPGYIAHVPMTLAGQLQRLGLRFDDVKHLAFSHEHIDHIGNANALRHATWLLNRREHEWTVAHAGHDGEPPDLLSASKAAHVRMIDGTVDLFGDGSVTIIQAPGHTPGHQVLLVRSTGERPVILAGDLWHSRSNYTHDRVPRINTSRTETFASFERVREIAHETGAEIWIAHEPQDFHPLFDPDWRRKEQ
jgi:glyoxylase-like metal-dependent hydrolase (beta-lactamase superfamily II)